MNNILNNGRNMKNLTCTICFIFINITLSAETTSAFPCPQSTTQPSIIQPIPKDGLLICDLVQSEQSKCGISLIKQSLPPGIQSSITNKLTPQANKLLVVLATESTKKQSKELSSFIVKNSIPSLPDRNQAYLIQFCKSESSPHTVLLMGKDQIGLLYACQTFTQLIKNDNSQSVQIENSNIIDYPDFEYRILGDFGQAGFHPADAVNKKIEMGKRYLDFMFQLKINGIFINKKMLPGMGQQRVAVIRDEELAQLNWVKEILDYGKKYDMHYMFFGSGAVGTSKELKSDPKFEGLMDLHGNLFTWADDELIRQRAKDIGKLCNYLGIDTIFIHYPDTVNENWVNRGSKDRERFGDDRAKADANLTKVFAETLKNINPNFIFSPVIHPYSPVYIKSDYYRNFIKDLDRLLPANIRPQLREYNKKEFQQMVRMYHRPYTLYYEPNRFIFTREGLRIGLDRSMISTSPRFLKTFTNGRFDNIYYNIWSYSLVDLYLNAQYSWNVNAPGHEDNFCWLDRMTPYDGSGNQQFFRQTLFPICQRIFGSRATPEMVKLFKLNIQTAFLLQPFEIAANTKKFYKQYASASCPKPDFDQVMRSQLLQLKKADQIVSALLKQPDKFPKPEQQKAFAKYYKEVKLLSWLAPINNCKWLAMQYIRAGKKEEAMKVIGQGLNLVEKARKGLPGDLQAIAHFKQFFKGAIRNVPCGPGASNWWKGDSYLDKYFKQELENLKTRMSELQLAAHGTPLSTSDKKLVQQKAYQACKITTPIVIDGKLEEAPWQQAVSYPFIKIQNADNRKLLYPESRGEAMICWDRENLYIALKLSEEEIDSMVGTTGERDKFFFKDDVFELFLQPTQGGSYAHLMSNISGRKFDVIPQKTGFGFENYVKWNPDWVTAIQINLDKKYWTAEIKIPFAAFLDKKFGSDVTIPEAGSVWYFNIGRERRMLECSSIMPCGSFHDTDKYAKLKFFEKNQSSKQQEK
jgi:cellulose/xylan binding protein with CBM9 domain